MLVSLVLFIAVIAASPTRRDVELVTAVQIQQIYHKDVVVVDDDGNLLSTATVAPVTLYTVAPTGQTTTTQTSVPVPITSTLQVTTPPVTSATSATPPAPATSAPKPASTIAANSQSSPDSGLDSCNSATYPDQCRSALSAHNMYRARHSAPPMTWDDALAQEAMAKMATAPCSMKDYIALDPDGHQSNAALGGKTLADATKAWYDEKDDFARVGGWGVDDKQLDANLAANGMTFDHVGHFINVIFKTHTKLGCTQNLNCGPNQYGGTNFLCFYSPYALNDGTYPDNLSAD